jgi:ribosomal protein S18 acetylase RimI-like enzyme
MFRDPVSEVDESNAQFCAVWKRMGSKFAGAETPDLPGLKVSWIGVRWPFFNMVALSTPVADASDLDDRVRRAVRFTKTKPVAGMVVTCEEWLPRGFEGHTAQVFSRYGLALALTLRGMVTNQLLPPRRPMPNLQFRRVTSAETRRDLADLNTVAYHVPQEWGREVCDRDGFWDDVFAYVGYRDGQAVTTASTFVEGGRLYVGWVATLPEARRIGCAEGAMRHSLEAAARESGLSRTVLHASEAGYPVYRAMGYRQVAAFPIYFPASLVV